MKLKLIAAALCLLGATTIHAKTLYVDQQARATGTDCTRSLPCVTIQEALTTAVRNDKIIVYPGYYSGPISITQDNLKLESLTGPRHTFIASDESSVIDVTGNNVTIGKKGKGFAIWKDSEGTANNTIMITVTANKVRIEGNHIWPFDFTYGSDESASAILINGEQATVKGNWIEAAKMGLEIISTGKAKHVVQENEMWRMQGTCIDFNGVGGGTIKIQKNNLNACRDVEGQSREGVAAGISVWFDGVLGKATISDNVVQRSPYGYTLIGGNNSILQRNQHTIGRESFRIFDSLKTQVKDSATQFVEVAVLLNTSLDTRVTANYLHANEILAHELTTTSAIKLFSKNEIARRSSGPGELCPVSLTGGDYSANPILLSGNNWNRFDDDADGIPDIDTDSACSGTNTETAFGNGTLLFPKPTAKNIAPRYRDRTRL